MMESLLSFLASCLLFILGCVMADQLTFVLEHRKVSSFRWSIIVTLALAVAIAALVPWNGWPALVVAYYLLLFLVAVLRGPRRDPDITVRRVRDDVADAVDQPYPGRPRAT